MKKCPMSNVQGGFTLFELLVVAALLALITGGAIAGFRQFEQRQKLIQDARDVKIILRRAQIQAQSGTKPISGCTDMLGVRFSFPDNKKYTTSTLCNPEGETDERQYSLSWTNFNPLPSSFDFRVLSHGVSNETTICLTDNNQFYRLVVTITGEVKDEGIVSSC